MPPAVMQQDNSSAAPSAMIAMARPSVVHFGGFQIHRTHKQTVRIHNNSKRTQRMTIHNPTTPFFKAYQSKVGAVAPGMWEEVNIEFVPSENRYFYDCLRVMCAGADPLVVPIHAYPVVNTAEFPTAVDFGKCSITETMSKIVPLKCHVPIEFEFELKIAKPHPFFEVFPLQGVIPANGQLDITINFHPLRLHSASMEIEVNISQFGFEPFVCTLTGAGQPETSSSEPLALEVTRRRKSADDTKIEKMKKTKKVDIKRPVPPAPHKQVTIGGILIPNELETVHHSNAVLNSQPGKLSMKDLKAAIENKSDDDEVSGRQVLEAAFVKQLGEEVEKEKNKEIRPALPDCKVRTFGDTPPTDDDARAIFEAREVPSRTQSTFNGLRGAAEKRQKPQMAVLCTMPGHSLPSILLRGTLKRSLNRTRPLQYSRYGSS